MPDHITACLPFNRRAALILAGNLWLVGIEPNSKSMHFFLQPDADLFDDLQSSIGIVINIAPSNDVQNPIWLT